MRALNSKPVYDLGDVTIDMVRGCLTRNGQEQYLRQQAFEVLHFLLENRQRLVTKEDFMEGIWHGTAVTDNALVQCIADIRKALGDDSHHPRFVKTIPKVGYRFIGHVEERWEDVCSPNVANTNSSIDSIVRTRALLLASPTPDLIASSVRKLSHSRSGVGAFVVLLTVAAATLFWLYRPSNSPRAETTLPHLPGKKPIAVMYFENDSARSDLDWMREGLADMFITDLARSDRLTVLSRQQLHVFLARTNRNDKLPLDEALNIAHKTHAEEVVLGQFAALGDEIRINVQVHDAASGQLVAADRLVVSRPADVLTQVDFLALKLAAHLGAAPLDSHNVPPLADTMTDSLEAYRYYSLGVEKAQAFENTEAIRLLQKAIQFDPNFAMAYARIGYAYAVTDFVPQKGRPYLEKAFQLSARLTAKDKLYLATWYAIARGDYHGAIGTLRQIVAQYPLESEAYWRLARLLSGEEQPDEAIRVLQQGLTVDPDAKELYNGLGVNYLALGRYDDAIRTHQHYIELAPREPNAHDSLGMSYQRCGQYDQAIEEYSKALALDPEFEPAIIHLGDAYFQQGRYHKAIDQYQRYIHVTRSDVARALGYSNIAHVYLREGNLPQAVRAAENEVRYAPGSVWNSLLIALRRNNGRKVEALKEILFQQWPYSERGARTDLRTKDYFRGYLALKTSSSADTAIQYFKEALRHQPPTSAIELHEDCLADAYLELGRLDEAIAEYRRVLRTNPGYPLAVFHLAQAHERKGARQEARTFYERFLQEWKAPDTEIPEVREAHRALARPVG
jgi:tetratricopeptide (TPR) repeat protein/DNA-binding winged helix-turn-helix (wHTH) protein